MFRLDCAGSNLNICSEYITGEQCCSPLNEDELGMRLNHAIRYNHTLGTELRVLQVAVTALNSALSSKHYSHIKHSIKYASSLVSQTTIFVVTLIDYKRRTYSL